MFASAIVPLLFSVAYDVSGTFTAGSMLCIAALLALISVSALIKQPLDIVPRRWSGPLEAKSSLNLFFARGAAGLRHRNIGNK